MDAIKFIQLLGSKGFLSPDRLPGLIKQVRGASKPVKPARLAKLLIEKGLLTEAQAKVALSELKQLEIDTELEPAVPELTPVEAPELTPIDSTPELAPIDSSPELTPVNDAPVLEPVQETELTPLDESAELVEVGAGDGLDTLEEVEPGALDEPLDEATGESAELDDDDLVASSAAAVPLAKKKKGLFGGRKNRGNSKAKGNRWDSPLMLVGGGALLLMIATAIGLWVYLNLEDGDTVYKQADQYYADQSYTQAIAAYREFAERFPKHPNVSAARVKASMSMLRRDVEGKRWDAAIQTANTELPKIKAEEAFGESGRRELSGLLPDVYDGYVTKAGEAETVADKQRNLEEAEKALALVDNSEYLPSSLRKNLQPRIEDIQERVSLIQFDINREIELEKSIVAIGAAAAANDPISAYDTRRALLEKYPGLRQNSRLIESIQGITEAERAAVKVNAEAVAATNADHPRNVQVQVVVAARQNEKPTGVSDEVAFVLANGAVYGIDANNGRVLWRRWVGYETLVTPLAVSSQKGADAIVYDSRRGEILRLAARDGKLVWRASVGEISGQPAIVADRIYLSAGQKVSAIDVNSGAISPAAEFPQTIPTSPAANEDGSELFVLGDHSTMYTLTAPDMTCKSVSYLGHQAGSISVPPITVANLVIVVENGGTDYARLHTLQPGEGGALTETTEFIRLDGHVRVPMQKFGRRILVVTDLGAQYVLEIGPNNSATPTREIAKTLPKGRNKGIWYPLVQNGQVFVAGNELTRYELQASRGELVRKSVNDDQRIYVGPLQAKQKILISVSRKANSPAAIVAATPIVTGSSNSEETTPLWSTRLGAGPAMPPLLDAKRKGIVVVGRDGTMWDLGKKEIQARTAENNDLNTTPVQVATATQLSGGKYVLSPQASGKNVLLLDPGAATRLRPVSLNLGSASLSSAPTSMGKNLLVCATNGTVHLVNPTSGKDVVLPFQPGLSTDSQVQWLRPAVVDPAKMQVAVADASGFAYLLTVNQNPKPHLNAIATAELGNPIVGETAFQGETVLVVSRDVAGDSIQPLQLPELKPADTIPLEGQVTWGPRLIGQQIVLATSKELIGLAADNSVAWRSPLEHGPLAGAPSLKGDALYLASLNGQVWRVSATDGSAISWGGGPVLDVGEPLGAGVSVYGSQLMLLGQDGTFYLTKLPAS